MRSHLAVYGIEPKEHEDGTLTWDLPHGKARFRYSEVTWAWTFDIIGKGPMKFRVFGDSKDRPHAIRAVRSFIRAFDRKFRICNEPTTPKRKRR